MPDAKSPQRPPAQRAARARTRSRGAARSRRSRGMPKRGLLPIVALLALWQVLGSRESANFPVPSRWWDAVWALGSRGTLWNGIEATLEAFVVSLAIALVLGVLIGLATGCIRWLERATGPLFEFLRSMPPAAVVPVFVLLLGFSLKMKIVITVLGSIWPILYSSRDSVVSRSRVLDDVAKVLQMSRSKRIRSIVIPSVIPGALIGLKVAIPITLIYVLVVEILTSVSGVGALLTISQGDFNTAAVYGLVVIAGILAILLSTLVAVVESAIRRRVSSR